MAHVKIWLAKKISRDTCYYWIGGLMITLKYMK